MVSLAETGLFLLRSQLRWHGIHTEADGVLFSAVLRLISEVVCTLSGGNWLGIRVYSQKHPVTR